MYRLLISNLMLLLITGCSIKVAPGSYSTAPHPENSGTIHMVGIDLKLTENGRFHFNHWSDDGPPTIGYGAYKIVGKRLILIFENANFADSEYSIKEITCEEKDTQTVNFIITEKKGDPLIGVNIYNKEADNGTISQIDGVGRITLPKEPKKRLFQLSYTGYETMNIEFVGTKCLDIDIKMKAEIEQLKRGHTKTVKLKREGDQLFIKMHNWKEYSKIYLRE